MLEGPEERQFEIVPLSREDVDDVVALARLAWEPVFAEWERVLGAPLFRAAISTDWRQSHGDSVAKACRDENNATWIAVADNRVAGFIIYRLDDEKRTGEVQMLAVHPSFQNQGIGTALNRFALDKFREAGMTVATVWTGGDAGHAPARKSYEKAGYVPLPTVRYYQTLDD